LNKKINIVSFDVPYPPNYGGAIDVFYKIIALKKLGFKIYLHTFEYGRGEQNELKKHCEKVYYYKRETSLIKLFSKLPFIIKSRANNELIKNLETNTYPILFEGLHTTFPLLNVNFNNRKTIVRAHNIEHKYYYGLAKSERNIFKKLFFISEAIKLKYYEPILNKVSFVLPISPLEQEYFSSKFQSKSKYISAFHQNKEINSLKGIGNFALYHGDLNISDNLKACYFLIKVFAKINYPFIIASSFINKNLLNKIKKHPTISFKKCPNSKELNSLLTNAHINILPTFQNTGIKLKLINALYNGRFCIVNDKMIQNTGLEKLCLISNSEKEFIKRIRILSQKEFTEQDISKRKKILETFNTENSAKQIINFLHC